MEIWTDSWTDGDGAVSLSFLRVGHNEIIGVCRVGVNAEGLGRDHWNEMLAYPRKPIAHWHPLVEVKKSFKEVCGVMLPFQCLCCAVWAGSSFPRASALLAWDFLSRAEGIFSPEMNSRKQALLYCLKIARRAREQD